MIVEFVGDVLRGEAGADGWFFAGVNREMGVATTALTFAAFVAFAAVSVWLSIIDVREHRLPNRIVLPMYPIALALIVAAAVATDSWNVLVRSLLAGAAMFAFYYLLHRVGGGMGAGDVKLAGVVGLALGFLGWAEVMIGLASAFLLGGLAALMLIALRRADRRTRIPFGPFLLAGAWVAIGWSAVRG